MNKWITFVKEWAAKNNLSYGCAISKQECKDAYRKANPLPVKGKKNLKKMETISHEELIEAFPDTTPKAKNVTIKKKEPKKKEEPKKSAAQKVFDIPELMREIKSYENPLDNYTPFLYDEGDYTNNYEELYLNPKRYISKNDEGKPFPWYIANALYFDIADAITRGGNGKENKIYEEAANLKKKYNPEGSLEDVLKTLKKLAQLLKKTGYTRMKYYSSSASSFRKTNIIKKREPKKEEPKKEEPKKEEPPKDKRKYLKLAGQKLEVKKAKIGKEEILIAEKDKFGNRMLIKDGKGYGVYDPETDDYHLKDSLNKQGAYAVFGKDAAEFYNEYDFLNWDDIEGGYIFKKDTESDEDLSLQDVNEPPQFFDNTTPQFFNNTLPQFFNNNNLPPQLFNLLPPQFLDNNNLPPLPPFFNNPPPPQNEPLPQFFDHNEPPPQFENLPPQFFFDDDGDDNASTNSVEWDWINPLMEEEDDIEGGMLKTYRIDDLRKAIKDKNQQLDRLRYKKFVKDREIESFLMGENKDHEEVDRVLDELTWEQHRNIDRVNKKIAEVEDRKSRLNKSKNMIMNLDKSKGVLKGFRDSKGNIIYGESIGNWVSPTAWSEYTTAVVKGRNDYPPKMREIIQKYGDKKIMRMYACRTPVPSLLTSALNAVSLGEFGKRWENQPYDKLFHLDLRIELDATPKTTILLEKNEVLNASVNPKWGVKNTECSLIQNNKQVTLLQLLEGAKQIQGDSFFKYSAYNNNCQDFIMALLKGSGIGTQENFDFIKQDTKELFKNLPGTRKFANTITDIGATFNTIVQGAGPCVPKIKGKGQFFSRNRRRVEPEQIRELRDLTPEDSVISFDISPESSISSGPIVFYNEGMRMPSILTDSTEGRGAAVSVAQTEEQVIREHIAKKRAELNWNERFERDLSVLRRPNPLRSQLPGIRLRMTELRQEIQDLENMIAIPTEAQIIPEADVEVMETGTGIHKGENYYIQSVVFDKNKFDVKSSRKWLKENNYVSKKPDVTDTQIRFRQVNPTYIKNKGFTKFRTKKIGRNSGISLIISYK
jgi:hypothetical protein